MSASRTRTTRAPKAFARISVSGLAARWLARAILFFVLFVPLQVDAQERALGPAITSPEVVQRTDAVYPPEALAARLEGTVVLFVTVEADGTVSLATVAESAGVAFDQAALAAVKQWKFAPARRGGQPISSRVRVPFAFVLPAPALVPAAVPEKPPATGPAPGTPAAGQPAAQVAPAAPTQAVPAPQASAPPEAPSEITVLGRVKPPSRGSSDYQLTVGHLSAVPHQDAADVLKLAPGILLTNEGGEGHAEQVFLRGFDAREG
ncbi:MAG TPA: TonB family protein, partial [Polyangiaceae bacterium]